METKVGQMDEFLRALAYPWNGASQKGKNSEIKRLCALCKGSADQLATMWSASRTAEQDEVLGLMREPHVTATVDDDKEIQRLYDLCRRAAMLAGGT